MSETAGKFVFLKIWGDFLEFSTTCYLEKIMMQFWSNIFFQIGEKNNVFLVALKVQSKQRMAKQGWKDSLFSNG